MASDENLKALFHAFSDANDSAFLRAAQAIITDEVAANHHALATKLQKALRPQGPMPRNRGVINSLSSLPKDRRNGEDLVALQNSVVSEDKIVLSGSPRSRIDRVLEEYRKRSDLAKHGYSPKTKLLFWGPPGCGKTFTAHHVAYELGMPIGVLRLNAVISSFLGDTASHLQRVFDMAGNKAMVLLLDEVDAVGKKRDDPNDIGELKRIVNSLLQAMDAFASHDSIIIAASNHQYLLDPAVWRRFDDIVEFPMPGVPERERYLRLLLNGVTFSGSFSSLAKKMSSVSYADIQRVITEAVKTMILAGGEAICASDIMAQYRLLKRSLSEARGVGCVSR